MAHTRARLEKARTLRRSVALPKQLMDEALRSAPSEIDGNFNRLVIVSLQEYIARRRAAEFDAAMVRMAADPAIQAECRSIGDEFRKTERDGLTSD